jgi:hypothetical protein
MPTKPFLNFDARTIPFYDGHQTRFTADELDKLQFPEIKWIIDQYVVEGLTLLIGKPKTKKSWLALQIGYGVAEGSQALGVPCEQGDVLCCMLEDGPRRVRARMKKQNDLRPRPPRLHIWTELPRLAMGGLDELRKWVKSVPNPRLIVIDVLAMVRNPPKQKQSLYEYDYEACVELRKLAIEFNIAILVVHHQRKMESDDPYDTASGTFGLTGAADNMIFLMLDRRSGSHVLIGQGRDLPEFSKAIQFGIKTCTWLILGEASDVQRSNERTLILKAITEAVSPVKPKDIADMVDMKVANVKFLLGKMMDANEVVKVGYGLYTKPLHSAHSLDK